MKKVFFVFSILFSALTWAQTETVKDSITTLDEVIIQATRIKKTDPFTQTNLTKTDIESRNLGQDVPMLLNYLPNIVTTSDAGTGVGYTGIRVRGSDATRVNVTINGIALNDSESHSVYWVDLPDFASSTQSMQLQRGVGTSTNGSGAFGASLNLLTEGFAEKSELKLQNSFGSFGTHKHNLQFQSGTLSDYFSFTGRLSLIKSDGYVDRASSDLKSFYLSGSYRDENTLIKLVSFGGHEKTYQSWYGVDKQTFEDNPTFNYAGAIYDDAWNVIGFYDNQVDDYTQTHYQLHWNQHLSSQLDLAMALHYTKGSGFYEEYEQDKDMADYGLTPFETEDGEISTTDLVRQKWLDNDYYGGTFSLKYVENEFKLIFGGAYSIYDGDHFGKVIWSKYAYNSEPNHTYYFDNGLKKDFNIFTKAQWNLGKKWNAFTDLQLRNVNYKTKDFLPQDIDKNWLFFNPKAGLTYQINTENQLYGSYAVAHREPIRDDFEYATNEPKPEKLNDYELGWRFTTDKNFVQINAYWMNYKDQLVLTGERTQTGDYIRANSGKSYRRGLEAEAQFSLTEKLKWLPNFAVSQNKNIDFYDDVNDMFLDSEISFSPNLIMGSQLVYTPVKNLELNLLNKYVGGQYMDNIESTDSKLDAYFITDFQLQLSKDKLLGMKEVKFSALVNNIFNAKYASNGYMWGTTPYYFPQAGTNFLAGIDMTF